MFLQHDGNSCIIPWCPHATIHELSSAGRFLADSCDRKARGCKCAALTTKGWGQNSLGGGWCPQFFWVPIMLWCREGHLFPNFILYFYGWDDKVIYRIYLIHFRMFQRWRADINQSSVLSEKNVWLLETVNEIAGYGFRAVLGFYWQGHLQLCRSEVNLSIFVRYIHK